MAELFASLDVSAAATVARAMATVQETIVRLGFKCPVPPAPVPPPTYAEVRRACPTMTRLDGPTVQQAKAERIDKTNEWSRMGRENRIRMVQLFDMAHRYQVPLPKLIERLIRVYQPPDQRDRLQRAAIPGGTDARGLPGLGFPLWRLAHANSWKHAAKLSKELGGTVTAADYAAWQQQQRTLNLMERLARHMPRGPLEGGNMSDYIKETRRRRETRKKTLERGVLAYRIAPNV